MKNMIRNSVIVLASVFAIGAAQAENNGGLMTEMMANKYPAKVIVDPAAQARLAQIQLPTASHQNGGLMTELLAARFPAKAITDEAVQDRLALVNIPVGNGYGGLRNEMLQPQQKLNAADNDHDNDDLAVKSIHVQG